ncbi:Uncharacterised protein [Chlamydia trachomatis]|nr:Uncharacterised protein [Chlamydia trachomatis]
MGSLFNLVVIGMSNFVIVWTIGVIGWSTPTVWIVIHFS